MASHSPAPRRLSKSSRLKRDRHLQIYGEQRDEPDLERIAGTVIALTERLVRSGLSLDEHLARVEKHQQIRAKLWRKGMRSVSKPLPGCECPNCQNQAFRR